MNRLDYLEERVRELENAEYERKQDEIWNTYPPGERVRRSFEFMCSEIDRRLNRASRCDY